MRIRQKKQERPNMDCVNLLTSILLCYPEINVISFEPQDEVVFLSYTIERILSDEERKQLKNLLEESLLSYYFLEKIEPELNKIQVEVQEKFTFINMRRDVNTFSHTELKLIGEVIKAKFLKDMSKDIEPSILSPDYPIGQLENIDTLLRSLKINPATEHLIGLRQSGRVLVYNK